DRKMFPWENPAYYLSALTLYVSVRYFLPEKKKEKVQDGDKRE
ncbi:unnamed protein product, partial [marine sediment metagenome]